MTDIKQKLETDLAVFALKFGLDRIKVESYNFIRDYQRAEDGQLRLVSEKAIIRSFGKVTKVTIGEGGKYANREEAEVAVRASWSAYFKKQREKRSEATKRGEAIRQKRYRERRKAELVELRRKQ